MYCRNRNNKADKLFVLIGLETSLFWENFNFFCKKTQFARKRSRFWRSLVSNVKYIRKDVTSFLSNADSEVIKDVFSPCMFLPMENKKTKNFPNS